MSDRIEWIAIITALSGLLIGLILIYLALATSAVARGSCSTPEPVKWHQQRSSHEYPIRRRTGDRLVVGNAPRSARNDLEGPSVFTGEVRHMLLVGQ
jgi:hypothetical protein